jgi:purine-nucleoside/S-methyl-5'-thioadenosine phosphorylase / adenosine deaminase
MNSDYCRSQSGAFLYHQSLAAFKWLAHGFSLRSSPQGGSEQSFGFNGYQSQERVERNRLRLVQNVLACSPVRSCDLSLIVLRQCHSDIIHTLTTRPPAEFSADGDGLVTNQPGLLLSVLTADCMPVLIVDTEKRLAAAVHAGWRGTLKRIVEQTLAKMRGQFASNPENCIAAIGPAIRGCCYDVGEEVIEAFHSEFEYASELFRTRSSGKRSLDLPTACRFQLRRAGVRAQNIFSDPACTSCNLDRFFSHRAEQGKTGRMISVIGILAK